MTVTCTTAGCENEGIPIEIADSWSDIDGVEHPVTVVQCGACFEWIIPPVEPTAEIGDEEENANG